MELFFDDFLVEGYVSVPTKTSIQILPFVDKEPSYLSDSPRYGTFMFGSNIPMWAILDQSKKAKQEGFYDILYVDKNANGNVLEANEKFVGIVDKDNGEVRFSVGDFKDPCSGWVYGMFSGEHHHTDWLITASAESEPKVRMSFMMDGSYRVSGPASGTFVFSPSKVDAPVQVLDVGSLLDFQFVGKQRPWKIGKANQIHLPLQLAMGGENSFRQCLVEQESFSAETPVLVELSYQTKTGEAHVHKTELPGRQGRFGFTGSIEVPEDAQPGEAKVSLNFPGRPLIASCISNWTR